MNTKSKYPLTLLTVLLIWVWISPIPVVADPLQQVKMYGYVKDIDGVPIANCNVTIMDGNFTLLNYITTDSNGYYELLVPKQESYNLWAGDWSKTDSYMFAHIPQSKTVSPQGVLEIRNDFNLRPGGNIVIHAYNKSGSLLRRKSFGEATESYAFVTDLSNLPYYSDFNAVYDEYSDSNWDLAVPTFVVLPKMPYRVHILWEVEGFGKIMLSADNEGKGYSVDEQGGEIVLNFNYEAAKSEISALQRDYDLFKSQGYSISDSIHDDLNLSREHLTIAEGYLSQVPTPDMEKAVEELNTSLRTALLAHERLHLERAEADIELYRKGNVTLKVLDEHGNPVTNSMVSYQQTTHDFLFGAVPIIGHGDKFKEGQEDAIQDILGEAGINYSQISCYWQKIEPNPGEFYWDSIDREQNIDGLLEKGYRLMGALALWFYRFDSAANFEYCPEYQDSMTLEELGQNIYEHMYALASRYKGRINPWVLNEPNLPWTNVLGLTWNQKLETYRIAANAVKDANTEAQVMFNSFPLQYEGFLSKLEHDNLDEKAGGIPFSQFLDLATEQRIPFDTIGLEFYYGGVTVDGSEFPGLDLVSVSNLFDQYAEFGKPIFAEEFSVPSTQTPNASWWHKPWDQETQAEYLKEFYTIAFSKPLVQEIAWSYGVSDRETFIKNGGLLDIDLNPKLSYYALKNLINSWTTSGTGETDERGEIQFRGFAGDYEVIVKDHTGQTFKTSVHITEQQTNEATVEFLTPTPTPTTTPTPTSGSTATEEEPFNTLLIFGPILGVFGAGIIAYLVRRRLMTK